MPRGLGRPGRAIERLTHLPPTGSSWIAVMLATPLSCLPHGGPSPLAAKLVADHGVGGEREPRPGRRPDARGPRAIRGAEYGRQPAIIQRGPGPERRGEAVLCGPGRRGARGRGCPARPHPRPAVTLSDMEGQGERSPRLMLGCWIFSGHQHGRTYMDILGVPDTCPGWLLAAASDQVRARRPFHC